MTSQEIQPTPSLKPVASQLTFTQLISVVVQCSELLAETTEIGGTKALII